MTISFSISLNSGHGPTVDAVRYAVMAEKQGLECVWYCQDLFQRDVWVFLTAAAANTEEIDLGTGIVTPYTVNPAELAMHAATLDEFSGGRVRLGVSVGAVEFLKWVGINVRRPLTAMRESFDILRRLFRGERVESDGKVFKGWTEDAYLRFQPFREEIPLYLGAQSPRMLELIGEIADGGLPLLFPPEYIEEVLEYIKRGAAKTRRGIEDIDVVGCLWFSVSKDPEAAKDALRDLVTFYGPHLAPEMIGKIGLSPEDFDLIRESLEERDFVRARALMTDEMADLAIHGTPDDCVERIEDLIERGLTHVRFGPPLGPDPVETIRLIGEEIIPHFRG
ncbi:MAG: LLM class flavin-dependent oxidoreductase [Candidatus Bathyarchaeota archaeon]